MATTRIDGSKAAETLQERLSLGDDIAATLTERTREDYARKITRIAAHVETTQGGRLTPALLADAVGSQIGGGEISQSTARALKAAALFWVADEAQHLGEGRDRSPYDEAYIRIRGFGTTQLPLRTTKTSGRKLKLFPAEAEVALREYAENTPRSHHAGVTLAFVRANLLVGLRPSEWFGAAFASYLHRAPVTGPGEASWGYAPKDDGKPGIRMTPCLRVENAKTGHGRANGAYRDILLNSISADELATLQHFADIVTGYAATQPPDTPVSDLAKSFFKPLQNTLVLAVARGLPDGADLPTLYSTRHQVVADAKKSGLTDREIAALFGHSSAATAKKHYGKKLNGRRQMLFRPSPESLAEVPENRAHRERGLPRPEMIETARDWLKGVGD